jgi:[ribosomal protein S18]-alanine N-acetyltransferase
VKRTSGRRLTATPFHAASMAAIHAVSFAPDERWGAEAILAQLLLPGGFGLVDPAGGMLLARVAADEAEILTLAVVPAARRSGIGRGLLEAAAVRAAAAGARTMFLEVAENNSAAHSLYSTLGYRLVGRREKYYPDGAAALALACPLNRGAATDA